MNTVIHSFLLLFIMFSTVARAFSVRPIIFVSNTPLASTIMARAASTSRALSPSSSSDGGTTVVDICQAKIATALEADSVKVTGACMRLFCVDARYDAIFYGCSNDAHILADDFCLVSGAYDDPNGSHISIEVVSSKFQGKRPVQRQQLVYKVRICCSLA
jgi:BolA-like protein